MGIYIYAIVVGWLFKATIKGVLGIGNKSRKSSNHYDDGAWFHDHHKRI